MPGPYPPHGWPSSPPPSPASAMPFELAMAIGALTAESRRHTEILLALQDRLIDLPERLSELMEDEPPVATPPPVPPAPSLGSPKEWVLAAAAVAALFATATGRIGVAELLEVVRKLYGLP
jgi:hypothetical protein